MRYIFFILLSFFSALCYGENQDLLLSGTVGKSRIVMELTIAGEEVYGNYYYEKTCINIPFEGIVSGNRFSFFAGSRFDDENKKERFQLTRTGNKLNGSWKFNEKTLDVTLSEVDPKTIQNTYTKSNSRFASGLKEMPAIEHLRTAQAVFERLDSVTVKNNITVQWFKEKHSGSLVFRIVKGLPQPATTYVNNLLESMQLMAFSEYGSCGQGEGSPEYSLDIQRYFINTDFFSVHFQTYYFCTAARPNVLQTIYNIDLKQLKELETEDLLQFPGYVKRTDHNFDDWANYRRTVFGPEIHQYLKTAYSDHMTTLMEDGADECNYDDPELWALESALITDKGFWIGAYFPQFARICDNPEWSFIPFTVFEDHINPAYKSQLNAIGK